MGGKNTYIWESVFTFGLQKRIILKNLILIRKSEKPVKE